jgi:hypothetical protein
VTLSAIGKPFVNFFLVGEQLLDLGRSCMARKSRVRLLLLDFLPVVSLIPHRYLLGRDRRVVAQGAQLGPGDLGVDAAAQAAVGAGDNVFSADDFSERHDSVSASRDFRQLDSRIAQALSPVKTGF